MKRLKGKTALITGGNSGVGEATAMLFAREGADVVITARRGEQLKIVAEKIKAEGGSVLAIRGDVSNPDDSEMLVSRTLETFGKLDILVNNAGVWDERAGNAIAAARTPNLDKIFAENPGCRLSASGLDVGLPEGQMGNPSASYPFASYYDLWVSGIDPSATEITLRFDRWGENVLWLTVPLEGGEADG